MGKILKILGAIKLNPDRWGWTTIKPDPMSIGTDRPMALVQTRRQGLKQDIMTSIVSTSGGSIRVAV